MAATGTPTPNIGLRRPQGTDPASVDDINYNSELIDTKMGAVGNTSLQAQVDSLNSKIGGSDIAQHDVLDLNSALPSGAGMYFFTYPNTASNRPAASGGMGLTLSNGSYGVQLSAVNRGSDGNTLYYRNFWDSGSGFGSWRLVSSTT